MLELVYTHVYFIYFCLQWLHCKTEAASLPQYCFIRLQIAEPKSEGAKPALHVNFDPELMLLLREVHYLGGEPFLARLPDPARVLMRSIDDSLLRSTATRLDTIVSRYNSVMTNMKEFEKPLFERKLAKIDEVGK